MRRILCLTAHCSIIYLLRILSTATLVSNSLQKPAATNVTAADKRSADRYYEVYKARRQLSEMIELEETTSNKISTVLLSPVLPNANGEYEWDGDIHHLTYKIKLKEDEKVDKLSLYFKRHMNSTITPSSVNVMAKINNTRVFKSSIDLRSSYNNWLKVRLPRVLSRKVNLYAKNIDVNESVDVDLRLKFRQPAVFKGTPFLSLPKLQRQSQHMISDFSKKNKAPKCIGQCCLHQLELDFDSLGWHWVIYPRKMLVNYCGGSCDLSLMSPHEKGQLPVYTRTLQAMLDKLKLNQSSMSCVADKWTSHLMLYRDFDGSIKSSYDSIRRIESCQCV